MLSNIWASLTPMQITIGYLVLLVAVIYAYKHRRVSSTKVPDDIMNPNAWEIGPIIDGENMSKNVPLHPSVHSEGWSIDIPYPTAGDGHVHYVTVPVGSLVGKTKIILKARLEMDADTKLMPVKSPEAPSLMTLYFQRKDDNWSASGRYETYRWYASFGTQIDIKAQEYVMEARFDQNWTAIMTSSRESAPDKFQDALENAGRIGFVLGGGGDGLGHGVYASGPARLVVTSFRVE